MSLGLITDNIYFGLGHQMKILRGSKKATKRNSKDFFFSKSRRFAHLSVFSFVCVKSVEQMPHSRVTL